MNTRRFLLPALLMFLAVMMLLPVVALAQEAPDATILDMDYEYDDDGNVDVVIELEITGLAGGEVYMGLWAIYADSKNFVPHEGGVGEFSDDEGDFVSYTLLTVPYDATIWEGENAIRLRVPGDAFPLGNYGWRPHVGFYDLETLEVIATYTFDDPEFNIQYETDFSDYGTDSGMSGIIINKVHYAFDDAYAYIMFDMKADHFPIGTEFAVFAYPVYADGSGYVESTNVDPDFTDRQGDIFAVGIYEIESVDENQWAIWTEADGTEIVLRWPYVDFPEGNYDIYPQIIVSRSNDGSDFEPIHNLNLEGRSMEVYED